MVLKLLILAIGMSLALAIASHLPLKESVNSIVGYLKKSVKVISSASISDHWKEKVLLVYAVRIFIHTGKFTLSLAAVVFPIIIISLLWPDGASAYFSSLGTVKWLFISILMCSLLIWVKKNILKPNVSLSGGYSIFEKLLHYLLLNSRGVLDLTFEIEKSIFIKKVSRGAVEHNVYVTGLARAGTTILMREIYSSGRFASLTYADMPLILAPNLWQRLTARRKKIATIERAHGDGIQINDESPEAFEDVFWRCKDEERYYSDKSLKEYQPDDESIEEFRKYVHLVTLSKNKARYLSKNNNNILRLNTLALAFPESWFLVPFREPTAHIESLQNQHERFRSSDQFTARYMRWLVHHEFGRTHIPYQFSGEVSGDIGSEKYWLSIWLGVYKSVLKKKHPNVIPVCLETLVTCADFRVALAAKIGASEINWSELKMDKKAVSTVESDMGSDEARTIYSALISRQNALVEY